MTQGGGLLQLVALGKQDVFLTGNPSVSWFKFVYRRHTNFAVESQQMYFEGTPNFGQKITCLVPRFGDLLSSLFLKITLPQLYLPATVVSPPAGLTKTPVGYVNSPGHALIQEISVQIGEQEIDKQTGEFLEIWSSLATDASQKPGLQEMLKQKDGYPFLDYQNVTPDTTSTNPVNKAVFSAENGNLLYDVNQYGTAPFQYPRKYDEPIMGPVTLYVPLRFWFCKNPGLALPLLAMQYHPVRINVTLSPVNAMFYTKDLYNLEVPNVPCNTYTVDPAQLDIQLWGDYIFLDVDERRRFVSSAHEYLIEQVQYTPPLAIPRNSIVGKFQLDFNHPIKEFIWVLQRTVMKNRHEYFNWSSLGYYEIEKAAEQSLPQPPNRTDLMVSAKIQLDGQDRFNSRDAAYFRLVQPYQRHTTTPVDRYIYVYSIALRPEDAQPSGTLNGSRIDNISIEMDLTVPGTNYNTTALFGDLTARVYATNYNILRVIDGYAGLLFSV